MPKPDINTFPIIVNDTRHLLVQTPNIKDVQNMLASPTFEGIGLITGDPGTGKTWCTHFLTENNDEVKRICLYIGMTKKDLVLNIARKLGFQAQYAPYSHLMEWLSPKIGEYIFVLDESNHFGLNHFESIRYFIDECRGRFLLFGTPIMNQGFYDKRTGILLTQFISRIGSNRIEFHPLQKEEKSLFTKAHLEPFMISRGLTHKLRMTVINAFWEQSLGNWRLAKRLIDACGLYMEQQQLNDFTVEVVEIAAQYLKS